MCCSSRARMAPEGSGWSDRQGSDRVLARHEPHPTFVRRGDKRVVTSLPDTLKSNRLAQKDTNSFQGSEGGVCVA